MEQTNTNATIQTDELLDNLFLPPLAESDATLSAPAVMPTITEPKEDMADVVRTLRSIQHQVNTLLVRLEGRAVVSVSTNTVVRPYHEAGESFSSQEKILEGAFTGEKMLGNDGVEYSVPPNYASKSKLVVGDTMKLTITRSGAFIYKQIHQVERRRVVGALAFDAETKKWTVAADGLAYRVLTASISFYRGQPGDEVVLLVPADRVSDWGAVDNVVHV